jgi:hypothetical protein
MVMRKPMFEESFASRIKSRSGRGALAPERSLWALLGNPRRLALIGAFSACFSGVARAQDDATTGIARERFKEGVQFFDQKQYDKARAAFVQAYALKRHPAVLLNLAQSELRSGHEAEAAKHFAQFLREAKEATEAERQSADSGLTAAKAVVAELAVNVDEDGAVVAVDGSGEGQSPLPGPVYLTPGSHTVSAKKEGREASVQISAVAGQSTSTTLRFRKSAPATGAAAAPEGDKGDNKTAEKTPPNENHEQAPNDSKPSAASESDAGKPATRRIGFFEWAADSPVAWAGGGVTALGIAGGIGFALGAKSNYDYANDAAAQIQREAIKDGYPSKSICTTSTLQTIGATNSKDAGEYQNACKKYTDHVENGDNMKTLSIVSWIVAGTAAAATVVVYLFDGTAPAEGTAKRSRRATATVAPWISGSERGLFVIGNF